MSTDWKHRGMDVINDFWYPFSNIKANKCSILYGKIVGEFDVVFYKKDESEKYVMTIDSVKKTVFFQIFDKTNKIHYSGKKLSYNEKPANWAITKAKNICKSLMSSTNDVNKYNLYVKFLEQFNQ